MSAAISHFDIAFTQKHTPGALPFQAEAAMVFQMAAVI
jgi:hypothetical protein